MHDLNSRYRNLHASITMHMQAPVQISTGEEIYVYIWPYVYRVTLCLISSLRKEEEIRNTVYQRIFRFDYKAGGSVQVAKAKVKNPLPRQKGKKEKAKINKKNPLAGDSFMSVSFS